MAVKVFINYRRDDSIGMAGRLHDRLAQTFGRGNLFMDVDNIPAGRDFEDYLNSQVAACDAMLAVIGPNWLTAKDENGQRRLDNPEDFVVIEIAAALARNIPVVPVLVDGARMPKAGELPDSLRPLVRRQAVEMRHAHFGKDAEALIARMGEALGDETLVLDQREALGDDSRRHVWPTLKKHLVSTAIGLVIGLLVLAWVQPLTSGGISLLLLLVVAFANAGALLIPTDKAMKVPATKKKTPIHSA
jgi:TIR domain-containing protein